jgi:hypothetical protein
MGENWGNREIGENWKNEENDFRNEKISKSVGLNLTTYKPFSIVHSKKIVQILFLGRKRACEKRGTHIASRNETFVDVEI